MCRSEAQKVEFLAFKDSHQREKKIFFHDWKNTSTFRQICTRDYNPLFLFYLCTDSIMNQKIV